MIIVIIPIIVMYGYGLAKLNVIPIFEESFGTINLGSFRL